MRLSLNRNKAFSLTFVSTPTAGAIPICKWCHTFNLSMCIRAVTITPMTTKSRRGRRADPSSKSGKIRDLLSSGMTAKEIAKKVGCTIALVYNIKSKSVGGSKVIKAAPNRRTGLSAKTKNGDLSAILTAVKNAENERIQMRAALEKISAVIQDALA